MKEKTILIELLHIHAPLMVAQLTDIGETLENIPWSKEIFLIKPYCVFHRLDGLNYGFYNQIGIDWKMEQAGNFDINKLEERILKLWTIIKEDLKKEESLDIDNFRIFIDNVKNFWTWLDCMWWMIEDLERKGKNTTEAMKIRKETEYFVPGLIAVIRNSLKKIVGDKTKYIDELLIEEVLNNNIPEDSILIKRSKECVYTEGKIFYSFEEVKQLYNFDIKDEVLDSESELKGQVAYSGKVKGKVKIIKTREDMKKFENGDIIVSSTTTPDFLPVMRISSAIISEHGGIICHAAITSRELKIPCVVGVKGATKILKDGDMVEVDADNGIVRIIK